MSSGVRDQTGDLHSAGRTVTDGRALAGERASTLLAARR